MSELPVSHPRADSSPFWTDRQPDRSAHNLTMKRTSAALLCTGIAATIMIVAFFIVYYRANVTNAFLDGSARLNLARRVIDNSQETPSLAQLGGIWLPLMPALEATLTWNDTLFRTGIAGSIISMASFVALVVVVFDMARRLGNQILSGIAAASVLLLNLNVLYFGTNTMAEMLLMATLAFAGLCILRLELSITRDGHPDLRWVALTSIALGIACLVRYEGYFVTVAAVPFLAVVLWRCGLDWHQLVAVIGTIFALPSVSILSWIAYEWIILGDPLYFVRSEYSARSIDVVNAGINSAAGNPWRALTVYIDAVRWNYPDLVLVLALTGTVLYALRFVVVRQQPLAPLFLLLIPAFYVTSLTIGEIGMDASDIYPYNVRYGLPVGVTLAVATGYCLSVLARLPWRRAGFYLSLATLVGLASISLPSWSEPVANTHILQDSGTKLPPGSVELADWLNGHYDGGRILLEGFGWDKAYVQMNSGAPLKDFLTESSPALWHEALADPAAHVAWIYIGSDESDAVGNALKDSPEFARQYTKAFENEAGSIYLLNDRSGQR